MMFFIDVLCFILIFSPINREQKDDNRRYIHISHTRTESNLKMDSISEKINYKNYDMLLLGGDLAKSTSWNNKTIAYVDSVFDLKNSNTLWSLGNHDYKNLDIVKSYTKRNPYYSYHKNGITFLVLDTQDSLSNITGNQKSFFDKVTDTLKNSSHLVVMHHKLIWMYGNEGLEDKINKVSNGNLGSRSHCLNPNNFYTDIYPRLKELKQKGVEIICLAGDIGNKVSEFEYRTQDGIWFWLLV